MSFVNLINRAALYVASAAAPFFANGQNLFFNAADYAAYAGSKTLGDAAALVAAGITDAGSINGTYFDSAGVMRVKSAGTAPRLNYVAGAIDAMLTEPAATNRAPFGAQIGFSGWNSGNGGSAAVAGSAPDGSTSFSRVTFIADAASRLYENLRVTTPSQQVTISVYAKSVSGNQPFRLGYFGDVSGTLPTSGDLIATTTLQRFSFTFTLGGTETGIYPLVCNAAAGAASTNLDVWGFQDEDGALLTSLIITNATALTRSAGTITQAKASVPNFSQTVGTWVAKFSDVTPTTAHAVVGSGSAQPAYVRETSPAAVGYFDGTNTVTQAATPANDTVCAMSYTGTAGLVSDSGGAAASGTWASFDPIALWYGSNAGTGNRLQGQIKRLGYSPTAASAVQLAQISAGTL